MEKIESKYIDKINEISNSINGLIFSIGELKIKQNSFINENNFEKIGILEVSINSLINEIKLLQIKLEELIKESIDEYMKYKKFDKKRSLNLKTGEIIESQD